jgi:uncharacterized protein YprB with RNaseH-like and TPR domain
MGNLAPVAFDIETSGLALGDVVTVAGVAHEVGNWLCLNTDGRDADPDALAAELEACTDRPVQLEVVPSEQALLKALGAFVEEYVDGDAHYLTAYNGETWKSGFDLPFLRSACLRTDVIWPFGDLAYADTMEAIERLHTDGTQDLVGVYDALFDAETCDPFEDSAAAVKAFEAGNWDVLLRHNVADIERTRKLAHSVRRVVPKSDFGMKNLDPPER